MIQSAAIIKDKTVSSAKELRLQKRKLKKAQTADRKATKQICPSPIGSQIVLDEPLVEDSPATREEMLQQAEAIGLKVDKRWSDATLLKHIEELAWATQNDNS